MFKRFVAVANLCLHSADMIDSKDKISQLGGYYILLTDICSPGMLLLRRWAMHDDHKLTTTQIIKITKMQEVVSLFTDE